MGPFRQRNLPILFNLSVRNNRKQLKGIPGAPPGVSPCRNVVDFPVSRSDVITSMAAKDTAQVLLSLAQDGRHVLP